MIRIAAPKDDLKTETKKVSKSISVTVYVSETGLIVDEGHSKITKYKTYVIEHNDANEVLEELGYEEAMTPEQINEQFEIYRKDAERSEKTGSMHS